MKHKLSQMGTIECKEQPTRKIGETNSKSVAGYRYVIENETNIVMYAFKERKEAEHDSQYVTITNFHMGKC